MKSVSATVAKAELVKGETTKVTVKVSPANATNKAVQYSSSDTSVAAVSNTGVVTAKGAGDAVITVISKDNPKAKANVTVTVAPIAMPENVTIQNTPIGVKATVHARPWEGAEFLGWYAGDDLVSADADCTFAVQGDTALTARFTFLEAEAPAAVSGLVYDGEPHVGVPGGEGYVLSGDASATDAGDYTAIAEPAEGYTWAGGSTDPVEVAWGIAKATSGISLADSSAAFTGGPVAYSGEVTRSGSSGDVPLAYYSDADCNYEVAPASVVAVGTYYVKATLAAEAPSRYPLVI